MATNKGLTGAKGAAKPTAPTTGLTGVTSTSPTFSGTVGGGTNTVLPLTYSNAGFDATGYRIDVHSSGEAYVAEADGQRVVFFEDPKTGKPSIVLSDRDAEGNRVKDTPGALQQAVSYVISNSTPQQIKKLKDKLLAGGFISKEEYAQNDFHGGLARSLNSYTLKSFESWKNSGSQITYGDNGNPFPKLDLKFDGYLNNISSISDSLKGKGGAVAETGKDLTSFAQASTYLQKQFNDYLGRPATQDEIELFLRDVNVEENKSIITARSTTSADGDWRSSVKVGAYFPEENKALIASKYVSKRLEAIGRHTEAGSLNKLINSGSLVAQDLSTIKKYAKSFGQGMTDARALQLAADAKESGIDINGVIDKLRKGSAAFYEASNPALANHLREGGTYDDIANFYVDRVESKLGIKVLDSIHDARVKKGMSENMSEPAFDAYLQSTPEWAETPEAHKVTNTYLEELMTSFGFGGK